MKPQLSWTGVWTGWLNRWTQPEVRRMQQEEQRLRHQMEAARHEVEAAENYFQTVTDPELVDHAIFAMEAARRKYLYLYRRLRRARGGTVMGPMCEEREQEASEWT